jgi:hypothetical protein
MHAPHRLMHACTARIAPWHHRPMHAVTAWALLFWFHFRYTFISSYFGILRTFCCHFFKFFHCSMLRNHKSNLCNDHNNKINVLPWLVLPSIVFKISRTKANCPAKFDIYDVAINYWIISGLDPLDVRMYFWRSFYVVMYKKLGYSVARGGIVEHACPT